jgi:hypothetical protein
MTPKHTLTPKDWHPRMTSKDEMTPKHHFPTVTRSILRRCVKLSHTSSNNWRQSPKPLWRVLAFPCFHLPWFFPFHLPRFVFHYVFGDVCTVWVALPIIFTQYVTHTESGVLCHHGTYVTTQNKRFSKRHRNSYNTFSATRSGHVCSHSSWLGAPRPTRPNCWLASWRP